MQAVDVLGIDCINNPLFLQSRQRLMGDARGFFQHRVKAFRRIAIENLGLLLEKSDVEQVLHWEALPIRVKNPVFPFEVGNARKRGYSSSG